MAFGKRKLHEIDDPRVNDMEEDEDHEYENLDDEDDQDVQFIDESNKSESQSSSLRGQKKVDLSLKPLLEEVIILGNADSKNPGGTKQWECKHCHKTFKSSYTRIHQHVFGPGPGKKPDIKRCPALLKNRAEYERIRSKVEIAEKGRVCSSLKNSKITQRSNTKGKNPIEESFAVLDRNNVDASIVRALCACGIPFNVLRNPQFCQMIADVNKAPKGYKAPSYEKARTTLLDEVKNGIDRDLIHVKQTWYNDGVSIVSDGWSNVKKNPLINILAVNSRGAMFLYAKDCSGEEKSGLFISKLLLQAIEEVGPSNVIQVVTDNAANCKAAGKEVENVHPHIFWSPCVVHTLNLVFKDLANSFDWFRETYYKGKTIVKYILNHDQSRSIFRANSKLELLKVAKTRFASHYIMLKRLITVRESLATTVVLNNWKEWIKSSDENTRTIGNFVTEYVMDDKFWEDVHDLLAITKPIYRLIRFCDRDGPIMSQVYEGMDNMIGEIKDNCKNTKYFGAYSEIEKIVLSRWGKMNWPVHCLGFALSPRFYDSSYVGSLAPGGLPRKRPNDDKEVIEGVLGAFKKISNDEDEAQLLRKQFTDFHMRKGLFSNSAAILDANTMDPIDWWGTYGAETPELADVAKKILSQPVTTSSAERNWSTYSFIHNVKRNRLNSLRADKLVYIHSNIRLLSRFQEHYKEGPHRKWDIDPEDSIIEDSQIRLEDMRWKNLEDDEKEEDEVFPTSSSQARFSSKPSSQTSKSTTNQPRKSQQTQISSFMRDKSGPSGSKDKGKAHAL